MRERGTRGGLALIVCIGVLLRCHGIGRCLWFDEAFSWRMSQFGWSEMAVRIGRDTHSPLYFGLLKLWIGAFGGSVVAMRSLSIALSALTLIGVYGFCRESFGAWRGQQGETGAGLIGLLGAALVAMNAQQIVWGSEVRMYSLATALAALSSWALFRALRPERASPARWALYGCSALAFSLAHYYGLFTLAAQGVHAAFVLCHRARFRLRPSPPARMLRPAVLAAGIFMAGWLAWLPSLLRQRAAVRAGWFMPPLNAGDAIHLGSWLSGLPAFPARLGGPLLGCALLLLGLALLCVRGGAAARYVALAAVLPYAGGVVLSVLGPSSLLTARYLLSAQIFVSVALAALAVWAPWPLLRGALVVLLLAHAVSGLVVKFPLLRPAPQRDLRAAAAYLSRAHRPGEPIIIDASEYLPLRYHAKGHADWRVYLDRGAPVWRGGAALVEADRRVDAADLGRLPAGCVFVVEIAERAWRVPVPPRWVLKERQLFEQVLPLDPNSRRSVPLLPIRVTVYEVVP